MFGIPESVLGFVAVLLILGVALFAVSRFLPTAARTVVRAFWCPFRWTDVTVEFREDPLGNGRYLDVKSCTAFRPASAIRCGKLCRYLVNFPSRRNARRHGA